MSRPISFTDSSTEKYLHDPLEVKHGELKTFDVGLAILNDGLAEVPLSANESKRIRRKVDWHLLPLLCLVYIMQWIDKNTLSASSILGIINDDHLTTSEFNSSASAFFVVAAELCVAEIPCRKVDGLQLVAMVLVFGITRLVLRFFLGACEACTNPGLVIVCSMFYTRKEISERIGLANACNGIAQIISSFLQFGLAHVATKHGLDQWQWFMIAIALTTFIISVVFFYFFPDNPTTAWFLSHEERILAYSLIIKSFGFTELQTTLLGIPSGFSQIIGIFAACCALRYFPNSRAWISIISWAPSIIACFMQLCIPFNHRTAHLIGMFLMYIGVQPSIVIGMSFAVSNTAGHTKKTTASAMIFIGWSLGNALGSQYWLDKYKPDNRVPWGIVLLSCLMSMLLMYIMRMMFSKENKRRDALRAEAQRTGEGLAAFEENMMVETVETDGKVRVRRVDKMYLDLTDHENLAFRYVLVPAPVAYTHVLLVSSEYTYPLYDGVLLRPICAWRLFSQISIRVPPDGSDDLELFVALAGSTEEFECFTRRIYQPPTRCWQKDVYFAPVTIDHLSSQNLSYNLCFIHLDSSVNTTIAAAVEQTGIYQYASTMSASTFAVWRNDRRLAISPSEVPGDIQISRTNSSPEKAFDGLLEVKRGQLKTFDVSLALLKDEQDTTPLSANASKRIRRKVDWHLLPLLCLIYTIQWVDKNNISSASILGLLSDNHLTASEFNTTASAFYIGYLVFQWPQNWALQRFPVGKSLFQGLHAVCHDFAGLFVLRFLLGACEACTNPALVLVCSMFYTRKEVSERIGWTFQCNGIAQIISGFIQFGLVHAPAHRGLAQWQWFMLTLTMATFITALLFLFFFPDNPTTAWFLSHEERILAVRRVRENQNGIETKVFKKYQIVEALTDPKCWTYFLLMSFVFVAGGIGTQYSLIIESFGFTQLQTTLLGIPSGAAQIIGILAACYVLRLFPNSRGWIAMICYVPLIVASFMQICIPLENKVVHLIAIYIEYLGVQPSVVIVMSWVASNTSGHTKKTTATAMSFIGWGLGNALGSQYWLAKYKPANRIPWGIMLMTAIITELLILTLRTMFWKENKRRDALKAEAERTGERLAAFEEYMVAETVDDDGKVLTRRVDKMYLDLTDGENLAFRYVL
ncbi:hypothetical protein NM688_g1012 [Phlebia brevispora]|uniref:Uncharacterized protein n=1 Tax=Phlebia brevispora TaxID=194682 RepID=A0ACC1TD00_9APHY|nr:hypothetical protein NM688_g1012 [Phlebia brevispora]